MTTSIFKPAILHKAILRDKGWSLRTAAPHLGVHFTHLHHVLQGSRQSRRLLAAIEALPTREATDSAASDKRTLPRFSTKS